MAAAQAATLTVFSNADSGAGTLRQAIFDASSGDTINFAINFTFPPYEIRLSSGELLINKNLMINGPGADKLTIRIEFSGGVCGGELSGSFHMIPGISVAPYARLLTSQGG